MWAQSNLAGYQDLVVESAEGVGNAEDIRTFVGVLEAEMTKGASFDTVFLCVVGRKALYRHLIIWHRLLRTRRAWNVTMVLVTRCHGSASGS